MHDSALNLITSLFCKCIFQGPTRSTATLFHGISSICRSVAVDSSSLVPVIYLIDINHIGVVHISFLIAEYNNVVV